MKKIVITLVATLLLSTMCACGNDKQSTEKSSSDIIAENEQFVEKKQEGINSEVDTEAVPKNECDHEWNEADCTTPKECKKCGLQQGEAKGHTWVEATCTEPRRCSVCGLSEGNALGHRFDVEPTCTESGICTVCKKEIPAKGHDWSKATCTEPEKCKVCGQVQGEPLGHTTDIGKCGRCSEIFTKVLYEDENVKIICNDAAYYDYYQGHILLDVTIENKSDEDYTVSVTDESANKYLIDWLIYADIPAGKITRESSCNSNQGALNDAGILDASDLETLEFKFCIYPSARFSDYYYTPVITINFT